MPEASSCWRPYAPPRDVDHQCLSLSAPLSALAWKVSAPGSPPPQHPSRRAADVMSVTAATGGGLPPPPLPRGKVISPTAPRIAYLYSAPLIQRTTKGAIPVEPLDVTKERMQLKRVMHESNRQVVWSQAVATISNFRNGVTMGEWERLEAGGCGAVGFTLPLTHAYPSRVSSPPLHRPRQARVRHVRGRIWCHVPAKCCWFEGAI